MEPVRPIRVVHYLNQFFAGLGGESQAGHPPFEREGPVGPGKLLEDVSQGAISVVATVGAGDTYFVENPEASQALISMVRKAGADAFIAGPAFSSGRYGEAVGAIAARVAQELGIATLAAMAEDNPALDRYRRQVWIVRTGPHGVHMRKAVEDIAEVLRRMMAGDAIDANTLPVFPRGLKQNRLRDVPAARRAVDMVLAKWRGADFVSEIPLTLHSKPNPAPAAQGLPLHVALVTDGGLVRHGNPERMPSGHSKRWCRIPIAGVSRLSPELVEVNHQGYDTRFVNLDPNRLVPLDVARELEAEGRIRLYPEIFSTAGLATAVEDASRFGREMAGPLKEAGVQAVILTST